MKWLSKLLPWLLLTCGPCAVHGQSIVVSGGQRSIVVSGSGQAPEPVTQPVIANPSPVVISQAPTNAPTDDGAAGEVFVTTVQERYLVSEPWCGYCGPAKARFLASGGKPENIISIAQAKAMGHRWGGGVPHEFTMQQAVEVKKQPSIETQRGTARNTADQPSNYTEEQRQKDIEHLLTHRSHAGKFTREYLETLSGYQLIDLHNTDHGVPTVKGQKTAVRSAVVSPSIPSRYYMYGNQRIDLETYGGCSSGRCGMCRTIRAQQAAYRAAMQQQSAIDLPDHQQPTPPDVVDQVVRELRLTASDVLADLGCGDGRILIAAVKHYGCRGIGVEIDPVRADEARRQVAEAGLSNLITIITGDALRFWPADHGVTAMVAYLYPDLLEKLTPQFAQVRVVVTPFHEVPGMAMEQRGDVFVRDFRG